MNMSDTLFVFLCTLLVWLMTPGLSLFYGGLVQSKNVLITVMQSMSAIVIVTFVWVLAGFSLSFGQGNGWLGDFSFLGLHNVGFATHESLSPHVPLALFMLFQLMFCTIAVSILSGSIAEKMKSIPYLIFVGLWVLLVYSPVAHWVWGGGWIEHLGAIDYAGGTVVHITSGVSGLVLAVMIKAGHNVDKRPPHNLVITLIGGIFVWLGWYGFNVGSAFTLDNIAILAFVNTVLAASAGALGVGGIVGALLTGVFQSKNANPSIQDGLLAGGHWQAVGSQFLAVFVTIIFSVVMTYILARCIGYWTSLATTKDEEQLGLDETVHGEQAYFYGEMNKFKQRH